MDLEKNSPHCIGRKEIEPEGFKRTIECVKKQALFFSTLQKLETYENWLLTTFLERRI